MAANGTVQPGRIVMAICAAAMWTAAPPLGARAHMRRPAGQPRTAAHGPKPAPLPCGDLVGFQVLLDRQGFSPGEIDGKMGDNLTHALSALQTARNVASTGEPDCETWNALGGDTSGPLVSPYAVTEADAKGPFTPRIPADVDRAAMLPALGYQSLIEKLGERFHAAPALLLSLNQGVPPEVGHVIQVPATQPFDPDVKPAADANAGSLTIQVSRAESALRATRADGTLLFFAPVSSGSEHDPLPIGHWKVTGVSWHPVFHYNPHLFWDAQPDQTRATLKAGPNNPVGIVWIEVNIDHYGIHGTPEPGHVGHTESHGCVRLTNWDAARLSSMVKPGTPVVFQ
jgi:lipoprotein-anchoring transpeptidase ErfK/SrfK